MLVVDDDPLGRTVVVAMLDRLGLRADVAGDGRQALDALSRASYDAVLMDCRLPVMDGYQATAELRRREGSASRTPVVALTASVLEGDEQRHLAAGMDAYLAKPVRIEGLAGVLRRLGVPVGGPAVGPGPAAGDDRVDEEVLAEVVTLAGDGPAGLRRLLEVFLDATAERIERLGGAAAAGDLDEVARAAHSIRGSAGSFGARRLSRLGAEIEAATDARAVLALLPGLECEVEAFRAILASRFPAPPPPNR